jgi:hypothetical protein
VAPDALFGPLSSSAVKQLVGLVDRVSYLGACELLLPPEDVSLLSAINSASSKDGSHSANPISLDPAVTGALLERQLDSLEPSRWKEGIRGVFIQLLKDCLQIYSDSTPSDAESMPIRRARVLVRCMEFAYHDEGKDPCPEVGCGSVEEMALQIERLAACQVCVVVRSWCTGKVTFLLGFGQRYGSSALYVPIQDQHSPLGLSPCSSTCGLAAAQHHVPAGGGRMSIITPAFDPEYPTQSEGLTKRE